MKNSGFVLPVLQEILAVPAKECYNIQEKNRKEQEKPQSFSIVYMMNRDYVFEVGPIRPPSEAQSLLLRITRGCTWNKCRFCMLYKHTTFKMLSIDEVKDNIDAMRRIADLVEQMKDSRGNWDLDRMREHISEVGAAEADCFVMVANWLMCGGKNVFLQDGNSLAIKGGKLSTVLNYLTEAFPSIERINSYGRAETLAKIEVEDFVELREAGLKRIHSGFESGSDEVLQLIGKGLTAEEEIRAGKRIREAGIDLSVYYMPGIGGRELSDSNALGTARVINEIEPNFIRVRTAAIKSSSELYSDYASGRSTLCSDDDKVREIRKMIENSHCDTFIISDHIVNLLDSIRGHLGSEEERKKLLAVADDYLKLSSDERKIFQYARRQGRIMKTEELKMLTQNQRDRMLRFVRTFENEGDWDKYINEMICQYI